MIDSGGALSLELADQRRAVRAAMTILCPQRRQVVDLAYFGGLTQRRLQVQVAGLSAEPAGCREMAQMKTSVSSSAAKPSTVSAR